LNIKEKLTAHNKRYTSCPLKLVGIFLIRDGNHRRYGMSNRDSETNTEAAGGLCSCGKRQSTNPTAERTGDIRELPGDVWETGEERRHGRVERRKVRMVTDIGWLEGKGNWQDLKTVIQYRCYREETGSGAGKWTER
jgi:hypothetical protein